MSYLETRCPKCYGTGTTSDDEIFVDDGFRKPMDQQFIRCSDCKGMGHLFLKEKGACMNSEQTKKVERLDEHAPGWRDRKHLNGKPLFSQTGTMLDENGNRSIFDDVDE